MEWDWKGRQIQSSCGTEAVCAKKEEKRFKDKMLKLNSYQLIDLVDAIKFYDPFIPITSY